MIIDKTNSNLLTLESNLTLENPPDSNNDQIIIDALERYLRRSSLARASPFPRWVRW